MKTKISIKEEIKYYKKQIKLSPGFPRYIDCLNRYIRMLGSKLNTRRNK